MTVFWVALPPCVPPSRPPSLGRTASGLQRADPGHPFNASCGEVGGPSSSFSRPCLEHNVNKVSTWEEKRGQEKEADSPTRQCHPSVYLFKICLGEVVRWPPPAQVPLDTLCSCSCVPGAGENWLFPKVSFLFSRQHQQGLSMTAKSVRFYTCSCFVEGLIFSPAFSLKKKKISYVSER